MNIYAYKACIVLVFLSVSIHFVGAFYAPCGWAGSPKVADYYPDRYWDWTDSEIERCIRKGLENGPVAFKFIKEQ